MNKPQLTSVAFADFKKANGITSVSPIVRKSENGLFVTFLTDKIQTEGKHKGKATPLNVWFARSVVDAGLVSAGQATADLGIKDMIICDTHNEAGELRQKLAYAGASSYVAI